MTDSPDPAAFSELWRSLTPVGEPDAIQTVSSLDGVVIRALSGRIGSGPLLWALEEAGRALESVEAEFMDIPELPSREIRGTIESWLVDIVALLADQDDGEMFVNAMSRLGPGAARREVPFERIIRSIRRVQSHWLVRFLEAWPEGDLNSEGYARIVAAISQVTDDGIGQFVVDYLDERSKVIDSEAMRRRELVRELLSGAGARSHTLAAEIASDFGFDIDHVHTAFVVEHQPHLAGMEKAIIARDVRARPGDAKVLIHPETHTRTVFWVSTGKEPGPAAIEPILGILHRFTSAIRAMGEPASGLEGFRRTYFQANDLVRVAPQLQSSGQVMRWSDHSLTLTLGSDIERARWFVRSALGPLSEPTDKAAEQRSTLQAYLSSGKSLAHAAEELSVHRNTIVYRIQRIEQLIERPLQGQELGMQCALHLVEQFGAQVLERERL
ncbi:PucR family transcriptional regulator [Streptomyces justiciae]|uniref:PucR family transcriptional regulator n=1 Tax=Streptomyces justiciae TaxID=2780140 RepID=UPI0021186C74|nr:helix-turn-helix domain-containing protein [Streptomyces justiciae]MCW8378644.1 helix-turn-helix domain-containing protein [Streptomyces justiciae]